MKHTTLQFIRGGQIFDYRLRTLFQVSNRVLYWAVLGFVFLIVLILLVTANHEIRLIGLNWYSKVLTMIGEEGITVWQRQGSSLSAGSYLHSQAIGQAVFYAHQSLFKKFLSALFFGGIAYIGISVLFLRFFIKKGEKYSKDKFVSGTRLAKDLKETVKSLKASKRGLSDIKLLNRLPMPRFSERQGIFFHGSTGSGKTQAMMQLLDQIRRSGDAAIVYDKECTIKPYFFNEATDIELNPVSSRCANWDLWEECENPMELGNLATYLIPKSLQGSDPFWVDAARTILISMAWKIRNDPKKSVIYLLRLLLTTTLEEMRDILHGTESENLVSREIEKTAISIKSVLATYTKALRFLEGLDGANAPKFSIKKWIDKAPGTCNGWLFITSRSKYHKEIKPLISLWLGLAMQGIQSLNPNNKRRIWLVMDELASLHRLEMLSDTLADIRKFGGCVAIGVQSISQLEFLYGNHESHAIADLLNTSVYFRSPKSRVARWVSEDLGEQVLEEVRESQSYGTESIRDGNTLGTQRINRKTVEAGTIMTLEDMECFVRLIGNHPVTKIKNRYLERPVKTEALTERKINFDALEKINQEALAAQNHPDVHKEVKKMAIHELNVDDIIVDEGRTTEDKKGTGESVEAVEEKEAPLQVKELI